MIPRYSRPEMTQIWEPKNKFQIWFEIEAHACDAMAEIGVIPKEAAKAIWEKGNFEADTIGQAAPNSCSVPNCSNFSISASAFFVSPRHQVP